LHFKGETNPDFIEELPSLLQFHLSDFSCFTTSRYIYLTLKTKQYQQVCY